MPAGFWVGVELDDSAAGKHGGEVKGVRLFGPCAAKGAICTRPESVVAEASTVDPMEEGAKKDDGGDEELCSIAFDGVHRSAAAEEPRKDVYIKNHRNEEMYTVVAEQ